MRKIFIDGGARIGEALPEFLDGREDMRGCEVLLFECNPNHEYTLKELASVRKDYQITVHTEALWNEDGFSQLYRSIDQWGDLGCTLNSDKTEKLDLANPIPIRTIRLSRLLNEIGPADWIILKLDIEGAEYEVVKDLIETDSIRLVNEIHIEWHDHFFPHRNFEELRQQLSKFPILINNGWW
jgi:FkbM family methyltransferase